MAFSLFSRDADKVLGSLVGCLNDEKTLAKFYEDTLSAQQPSYDDREPPSRTRTQFFCKQCGESFHSHVHLADHRGSQWHQVNVHNERLRFPAISQKHFNSHSAKDQAALLERLKRMLDEREEKCQQFIRKVCSGPFTFLEDDQFNVYRCYSVVLPMVTKTSGSKALESLRVVVQTSPVFVVLLMTSGNFAGAVYKGPTLLDHVTDHRYTVRAKMGSAQSSKDSRDGPAKSAGATLRRYAEQALSQGILKVLLKWRPYIEECHAVFLHCPNQYKWIFFGDDLSPLKKSDKRIRKIPLSCGKPTFDEVQRIYETLTMLTPMGKSECVLKDLLAQVELAAKVDDAGSSEEPALRARDVRRLRKRQDKDWKTDEIDLSRLNIGRNVALPPRSASHARDALFTACTKGFVQMLTSLPTDYGLSEEQLMELLNYPFEQYDMAKPLHLASVAGYADVVKALLEFGCDPNVNNGQGLTPIQLTSSEEVKAILMSCGASLPIKENDGTDSDSNLKVEKNLAAAERSEARRQRQKLKNQKKRQKNKEKLIEAEERRRFLVLSDAEKLNHNRCFTCAGKYEVKDRFEYDCYRFCSMECLTKHRFPNGIS